MQNTQHARSWSFLPKSIFAITLGLIAVFNSQTAPADVVTDPVGFITLNVTAGVNKSSYLGLGMTQVPTNIGLVGSVNGTQIVLSNQNLTVAALNAVAGVPKFFVEETSGVNPGFFDDIVSNDSTSIVTAVNDSGTIAAGNGYKIYPHWSLAKVFGANDEAGLQGGTGNATADNVLVWNPATQGSQTYYFKTNTAGGGSGWRSSGSPLTDKSGLPLYIDQGLVILRRPATGTNVLLVGAVKLGKTISPIIAAGASAKSTYAANCYPATFSLGNSLLWTGSSSTGLQGGTGNSSADNVLVWNPATQGSQTYYFKTNTAGGGSGWRSSGSPLTDQSAATINIGTTPVILRRNASNFNWVMPQPFTQ